MKESESGFSGQEDAETNQETDKISEKPEVTSGVRNEAEKTTDVNEKVAEATSRIDEIGRLMEEYSSIWQESRKIRSELHKKMEEISALPKMDKAINTDLRRVLGQLFHGNWAQDSEKLKKIRKGFGAFSRGNKESTSDKAIIDLTIKKFPALKQAYDKLLAEIIESKRRAEVVLKTAEQKRVELMQDVLHDQGKDSREMDNIKKQFQEKTGRSLDNELISK